VRVLIYKRTHKGDPDQSGWFGHNGCMGKVRRFDFQAVIGIGGIGAEPAKEGIAGRINWIGTGAHAESHLINGGPVIIFKHFRLFEKSGKELNSMAPKLAGRFYSQNAPRYIFSDSPELTDVERKEIESILKMAQRAIPSKRYSKPRESRICPPEGRTRSSRANRDTCVR